MDHIFLLCSLKSEASALNLLQVYPIGHSSNILSCPDGSGLCKAPLVHLFFKKKKTWMGCLKPNKVFLKKKIPSCWQEFASRCKALPQRKHSANDLNIKKGQLVFPGFLEKSQRSVGASAISDPSPFHLNQNHSLKQESRGAQGNTYLLLINYNILFNSLLSWMLRMSYRHSASCFHTVKWKL